MGKTLSVKLYIWVTSNQCSALYFFILDHPKVPDIDLAFGLSATAASKEGNYKKMKDILKDVVSKYGQGKIRYAIINIGKIPESVTLKFSNQ